MITAKNLVRHELIGLNVEITASAHNGGGLCGRVVNETRNTLVIEVNGREKMFSKEENVFIFVLPSGERVRLDGRILVARAEDRVKKKLKKW